MIRQMRRRSWAIGVAAAVLILGSRLGGLRLESAAGDRTRHGTAVLILRPKALDNPAALVLRESRSDEHWSFADAANQGQLAVSAGMLTQSWLLRTSELGPASLQLFLPAPLVVERKVWFEHIIFFSPAEHGGANEIPGPLPVSALESGNGYSGTITAVDASLPTWASRMILAHEPMTRLVFWPGLLVNLAWIGGWALVPAAIVSSRSRRRSEGWIEGAMCCRCGYPKTEARCIECGWDCAYVQR